MDPQNPIAPTPIGPDPLAVPPQPAPTPEPSVVPAPTPETFTPQPQPMAIAPDPVATPTPDVNPAVEPLPAPGSQPLPAPGSSNPYAQPGLDGGQQAQSSASIAGPVPLAQPASMPAFMTQAPTSGQVNAGVGKKKSKLLLIVIIIVVLALIGGGAAFALTRKKNTPASNTQSSSSSNNSSSNSTSKDDSNSDASTKSGITAKYSVDFEEVCKGGSVANSAAYTSNKTAIIFEFHNSAITSDSWISDLIGYGKSYYLEDLDKFETINVVACSKYVDGSANGGIDCPYDSNGSTVTIKYKSTKYKVTYYEAKTGKKISDAGEVAGTATKCPSTVLYDKETKTAFAEPDEKALEAAFDSFVQ